MQVERAHTGSFTENKLPDGSRILVDSNSERVIALNATAGAAWDACSAPTTLTQMTEEMQRTLNSDVDEELAADAVRQLEEQRLVSTSGASLNASRRAFMGKMGAVAAMPMVAALTLSEQRAFANRAVSGNHKPTAPPTLPPQSPPKNHGWSL